MKLNFSFSPISVRPNKTREGETGKTLKVRPFLTSEGESQKEIEEEGEVGGGGGGFPFFLSSIAQKNNDAENSAMEQSIAI